MYSSNSPIQGVYGFAAAGSDVRLFDGAIKVGGVPGKGTIDLRPTRGIDFRWETDINTFGDVGRETSLEFTHPELGPARLTALVLSSEGRGVLRDARIGHEGDLDSALLHWTNVPDLSPRGELASSGRVWPGRWEVSGGGWQILMDSPHDASDRFRAAKESGASLITHVMSLERSGGAKFSADELEKAAASLHWALSFAVGHWVAPALIVGFSGGARVFELWAPWRCERPLGPYSWWVQARNEDLTEFCGRYLDAYHFSTSPELVRYYTHHLVESRKESMVLEARVLLLGAANEYLSWIRHVGGGLRTSRAQKEAHAVELLRELLREATIDATHPIELAAISTLIASMGGKAPTVTDGPGAITWVRNRLAHPKNASDPYSIEDLLSEAWTLLQQYSDLILLNAIGYKGNFQPLYPPGRWTGPGEPVPWST